MVVEPSQQVCNGYLRGSSILPCQLDSLVVRTDFQPYSSNFVRILCVAYYSAIYPPSQHGFLFNVWFGVKVVFIVVDPLFMGWDFDEVTSLQNLVGREGGKNGFEVMMYGFSLKGYWCIGYCLCNDGWADSI